MNIAKLLFDRIIFSPSTLWGMLSSWFIKCVIFTFFFKFLNLFYEDNLSTSVCFNALTHLIKNKQTNKKLKSIK